MPISLPHNLYVIDDALSYRHSLDLVSYAQNSFFRIDGWKDTSAYDVKADRLIHSEWMQSDWEVNMRELYDHIYDSCPPLKSRYQPDQLPVKTVLNLAVPGEQYISHNHGGKWVLLLYVNTKWERSWGGETIFYTRDNKDIDYVCEVKPNRAVWFDGEIPHTLRPPSYNSTKFRMTLSMFYDKADARAE